MGSADQFQPSAGREGVGGRVAGERDPEARDSVGPGPRSSGYSPPQATRARARTASINSMRGLPLQPPIPSRQMALSLALDLTTPAPPGSFVSSISTPADLKAELTDDEYVTFCEAARTKGFADKWFKLTPDEAASLAAPPYATPPARSAPPRSRSEPAASTAEARAAVGLTLPPNPNPHARWARRAHRSACTRRPRALAAALRVSGAVLVSWPPWPPWPPLN